MDEAFDVDRLINSFSYRAAREQLEAMMASVRNGELALLANVSSEEFDTLGELVWRHALGYRISDSGTIDFVLLSSDLAPLESVLRPLIRDVDEDSCPISDRRLTDLPKTTGTLLAAFVFERPSGQLPFVLYGIHPDLTADEGESLLTIAFHQALSGNR